MSSTQIKALISELRGRYAIPRKHAAEALVGLGAAAVPALIEVLKDKNADAQQAAAGALERIGTAEALAAAQAWREQKQV